MDTVSHSSEFNGGKYKASSGGIGAWSSFPLEHPIKQLIRNKPEIRNWVFIGLYELEFNRL
jgi:hypothetical protein